MADIGPTGIQASLLQQLLGYGEELMKTPTPQGQTVGRTYKAASPLEHLSTLASKLLGGHEVGQARSGMSDLAQKILGDRQNAAAQFGATKPPDFYSLLTSPADDPAAGQRVKDAQDAIAAQRKSAVPLLFSDDPQVREAAKAMFGESDKNAQTMTSVPQTRAQLASEAQRLKNIGPSDNLGGLTPTEAEAKAKLDSVPKFTAMPGFPVVIDQRTGKATTLPVGPDGLPVDFHTQRAREQRKASLYVGPDLEPTDALINAVGAGGADPNSPGMKQSLEKLGKLNSAAAGFSDVAQRLRDFLQKHPNGAFAGSDATEAEAIAQDLRSLYMENLNMQTLRASDIPILNKVIADPTQLGNMAKSATGMLDLNRQLDTAVNLAKQRALSQAASLGYAPTKTGRYANFQQRTDQGGAGGGGGGMVDVIAPDGTEGSIPAANLRVALQRGYKLAGQ